MDMDWLCLGNNEKFLLVKEGKEEKIRIKCGLVMHQKPRLLIYKLIHT